LPVIADSYMGIFMPADISHRIKIFMAAKTDFPFIKKEEMIAAFYLFGKDYGVEEGEETRAAVDIAKRTVEQMAKDIRLYTTMPQKIDSKFIRENYTKRSLQIVVDSAGNQSDIDKRVAGDPMILSDCFAQHIAYYKQRYFFEIFQPFKAEQLPAALQDKMKDRMLLLGFNIKDRQSLPFKSSLEPFFKWLLSKV
jgi:hypothetical protein